MSMTELERHLLNCLEKLQQDFTTSVEIQNKRLANIEIRQEEQQRNLNQLAELFKELEPLLQRLNNILQRV